MTSLPDESGIIAVETKSPMIKRPMRSGKQPVDATVPDRVADVAEVYKPGRTASFGSIDLKLASGADSAAGDQPQNQSKQKKQQHNRQQRGWIRRDRVFKFLMPAHSERLDLSHGTILYMEDVSVSFDGFKAIDALNFYVQSGELRCVIGPNGAGKTTMMDIITGKTRPDTGSVYFGRNLDLLDMDESEIASVGIGRKFQKPTVFEEMSVGHNLELAMADERSVFATLRARLSGEEADRIAEIAELIGLKDQILTQAGGLSHGQKQWLEIGLLLMQRPHLLLVDEPVAGMTHQEMDKTGELLLQLAGDHTVVVVEHDMEFVRSIASTVTVLHQGTVLAEGPMEAIQSDPEVRRVYLGQ